MVTFSPYPADPRPRRAVEALLKEGMSVDLICQRDGTAPDADAQDGLTITSLPISNRRGGKLAYAYQYSAFISVAAAIVTARALRRRYDLVHIHNMPDVLVMSAIGAKALGAKVILDLHDPMPELMRAIFKLSEESWSVRLLKRLEKWSIAWADVIITVNTACKNIFAARSCSTGKIRVVMNAPDEQLFPLQPARAPLCVDDRRSRPFIIMYHGSLVERNGLDLAIAALAEVRQFVTGAELRIYGRKTAFLESALAGAQSMGLHNCVRYLGPNTLDELANEIAVCDVGVIPNRRNAFTDINTPTRIFEYLALGKPVIAPRTPGIEDYFSPESLLFFAAGDANALAQKILFVASHPDVAAEIARRGQEVYLRHRWSKERQVFVDAVDELLQTR